MTKAKTATKSAADAKKNGKARTQNEEKPKTAKAAAPAKKPAAKPTKKPARETSAIPAPKAAAKAAAKPAPKAAESKPISTPVMAFSNAGLGIKVSSKKPGLAVAPGVMILGRPAQVKTEQTARPSDRRLSQKEKEDIKSFLLEQRERLLAGMRRELAMQKERATSKVADEVDKATDAYDEDLSFEIAVANDQELEEIQIALEKIEKGTYGECEICGCSISPSRLKILPSASTCVSCRGQEEMSRRRDDGTPLFSMLGEDGDADAEIL